jgi:hypothetical protein
MMAHESKRPEHLTRKTTYESCCETYEAICLYEFIKVYAQKLHRDTQMITEVEVFCHFDNVMLLFLVL